MRKQERLLVIKNWTVLLVILAAILLLASNTVVFSQSVQQAEDVTVGQLRTLYGEVKNLPVEPVGSISELYPSGLELGLLQTKFPAMMEEWRKINPNRKKISDFYCQVAMSSYALAKQRIRDGKINEGVLGTSIFITFLDKAIKLNNNPKAYVLKGLIDTDLSTKKSYEEFGQCTHLFRVAYKLVYEDFLNGRATLSEAQSYYTISTLTNDYQVWQMMADIGMIDLLINGLSQ
jgi:hypothetical protein